MKDAKGRVDTGYRMHAFICGHTRPENSPRGCCSEKNAVRERGIDDVRVQKSGCLDFCENGISCVVYPQGEWFTLTPEAIPDMLDYLEGGVLPVAHLMNLKA
jgi:(2Fe-2S) ferredoxin